MEERLEQGFATYGDISFTRPAKDLVNEIEQEILDQVIWSYILYVRLRRLEKALSERTAE